LLGSSPLKQNKKSLAARPQDRCQRFGLLGGCGGTVLPLYAMAQATHCLVAYAGG